jgi:hypothetical protein
MKNGLIKVIGVATAIGLVVAFGTPQVGKRKGGGGSSGTSGGSTGSGSSGGSGGGGGDRRNDPPPQRTTGGGGGQGGRGGGSGSGGSQGGGSHGGGSQGGGDQSGNRGGGSNGGGWPNRQGDGTVISGGQVGKRSRSGNVDYHTDNNVIQVGGVRITRPPQINSGMQRRIHDTENVGLISNGWRVGYHHYNRQWRDDYFNYPFYVFNPWDSNRFVCSPWYYYASCPPYLNYSRIIVISSGWPDLGWSGNPYRYDRPGYDNRYSSNNDLDYAIRDLQDAFEKHDDRAMDRLIPQDGNVHLYFDGRYGYSVAARDFYDLFEDGISNVETVRYDVTDVEYRGNGARVYARHDYIDSFGQRATVYHQYFLSREGRDWVIREFGTGTYRPY